MNTFHIIQSRRMYFLSESVNGIANGELSPQREDGHSTVVINTRRNTNNTTQAFQMSPKNKVHRCMRNSTTRLVAVCLIGISATIGGAALLVLHFACPDQDGFLIPALSLLIAGIAVTSVGDWYCRTKLWQRQLENYIRQVAQQTSMDNITNADENSLFCDLPPPYIASAENGLHQLPLASDRINGNNLAFVTETSSNRSEPAEDELPSYNALTSNPNDTLPSYQDVVKTAVQTDSAGL